MTKKLSDEQILEIQNRYKQEKITYRELASEYGVCHTTITRIMNPSYKKRSRELASLRASEYRKNRKEYARLSFHLVRDADIIEKLDSVPNRQKYIKNLIRKDIEKS